MDSRLIKTQELINENAHHIINYLSMYDEKICLPLDMNLSQANRILTADETISPEVNAHFKIVQKLVQHEIIKNDFIQIYSDWQFNSTHKIITPDIYKTIADIAKLLNDYFSILQNSEAWAIFWQQQESRIMLKAEQLYLLDKLKSAFLFLVQTQNLALRAADPFKFTAFNLIATGICNKKHPDEIVVLILQKQPNPKQNAYTFQKSLADFAAKITSGIYNSNKLKEPLTSLINDAKENAQCIGGVPSALLQEALLEELKLLIKDLNKKDPSEFKHSSGFFNNTTHRQSSRIAALSFIIQILFNIDAETLAAEKKPRIIADIKESKMEEKPKPVPMPLMKLKKTTSTENPKILLRNEASARSLNKLSEYGKPETLANIEPRSFLSYKRK